MANKMHCVKTNNTTYRLKSLLVHSMEKENKFVCPCHASAFDITGNVINAPAPRALDIYAVNIENDIVKVDTGKRLKRSEFKTEQVTYPSRKG